MVENISLRSAILGYLHAHLDDNRLRCLAPLFYGRLIRGVDLKPMQVILSGYYGFGNGGDEALLATLLQMLPAHVSPLVLSANPQATTRQYQVKTCDRNDSIRVFQAIRQSQAFIWVGAV